DRGTPRSAQRGTAPRSAQCRPAPRGDPHRHPRAGGPARAGGDADRRRGAGPRGQPRTGVLPLRHQGRSPGRGLRARGGARPRAARRRPRARHRARGPVASAAPDLRSHRLRAGVAAVDRRLGAGPAGTGDPHGAAPLQRTLERGVPRRGRGRGGPGRLHLRRPGVDGGQARRADRRAVGGQPGAPQRQPRRAAPVGGRGGGRRARAAARRAVL
ncbi:MAG: hypothetical protein AVDCRST_MAG34-3160, partial [uncultured Nocardioidaceae bacterium]